MPESSFEFPPDGKVDISEGELEAVGIEMPGTDFLAQARKHGAAGFGDRGAAFPINQLGGCLRVNQFVHRGQLPIQFRLRLHWR